LTRIFAVFLALISLQASGKALDFHSELRLAKGGELTVTERITLEVQEGAPGLVRELPASARVVDVIRNGHPEPYVLDDGRLRIGRAPLPAGRHLYQISYRVLRQVQFLERHDELHWSLKGAERITAEVILPAAVPARDVKAEASGKDSQTFVRNGRAAFRAGDAMTIVVRFPKDVVTAPSIGQRARWFFADYLGLLLVVAGLSLTAAALLHLKNLSART
jgi:hypothetical protein